MKKDKGVKRTNATKPDVFISGWIDRDETENKIRQYTNSNQISLHGEKRVKLDDGRYLNDLDYSEEYYKSGPVGSLDDELQKDREQIVMCLMSSSPSIKTYGVAAWLIDNVGFSIDSESIVSTICLTKLLKENINVFDDYSIQFSHPSLTSSHDYSTRIYFDLYGRIGIKVYESIKTILASVPDNSQVFSCMYKANALVQIPELSNDLFTNQRRRRLCKSLFNSFLSNEIESGESSLTHFLKALDTTYQFASGFTDSILMEGMNSTYTDEMMEMKKKECRYLKRQMKRLENKEALEYLSAEEKETKENTYYLRHKVDKKELKARYKAAKRLYEGMRASLQLRDWNGILKNSKVKDLIELIGHKAIRTWIQEHKEQKGT